MPADTGEKLMQYLTSDNSSSHVMITDTKGNKQVVNKFDIKKIQPQLTRDNYKTFNELPISNKSLEEKGDGYKKFQEARGELIDKSFGKP